MIAAEMELILGLILLICLKGKTSSNKARAVIKILSESIRNIWFKLRKALREIWRQGEMIIKTQGEKNNKTQKETNNKNHLFSRQSFKTLVALEPSIMSRLQNKQYTVMILRHLGLVCKAAGRNSWRCL